MHTETTDKFESWGLLELFGRQRLAGKLSEQTIGGCHFIRIDVPEVGSDQAYTRFFTQGAIYGMTPLEETTARKMAAYLQAAPVCAYELREGANRMSLPAPAAVVDELAGATEGADVSCGEVYEGLVTHVLDFGALVNVAPGVEGLLHISQIAHHRVDNVADYLAEGQLVRVKVIETDERGRVRLSMKALVSKPDADIDPPF